MIDQTRARVLLLEDDAQFAERLVQELREPGISIQTASSVEEARRLVSDERFDLAIVDVRLGPDEPEGGLSVVRQLLQKQPATQVVLYSAFLTPGVADLAGPNVTFLPKGPGSTGYLRHHLWSTLSRRTQQQGFAAAVASQVRSLDTEQLVRIEGPPPASPLDVEALEIPARYKTRLLQVDQLPFEILRLILDDPRRLHSLTPRQFEEFTAEILERLRFSDIILTPPSGDGGRDVIASKRVNDIPLTFYFECKKYTADNKVQLDTLRALLGVVAHEAPRTNIGVLVTTSTFTRGAEALIMSEARLDGKDYDGLLGWVTEVRQAKDGDK